MTCLFVSGMYLKRLFWFGFIEFGLLLLDLRRLDNDYVRESFKGAPVSEMLK